MINEYSQIRPGEDPQVPNQRQIHEESVRKTQEWVALTPEERKTKDTNTVPVAPVTEQDRVADTKSGEELLKKTRLQLRAKFPEATQNLDLDALNQRQILRLFRKLNEGPITQEKILEEYQWILNN